MKQTRRNLLRALNSMLAAIIALLGVTSCNSQKKLAKGEAIEEPAVEEQPHIMVKYGVPFRKEETQVRVMYGVPAAPAMVIEEEVEDVPADTIKISEAPAQKTASDNCIVVKYGVPPVEGRGPLYLLNGKEIPAESVGQLNTDNIAEIKVLSPEDAKKKYGEKGKNGVVEIFSKSGK